MKYTNKEKRLLKLLLFSKKGIGLSVFWKDINEILLDQKPKITKFKGINSFKHFYEAIEMEAKKSEVMKTNYSDLSDSYSQLIENRVGLNYLRDLDLDVQLTIYKNDENLEKVEKSMKLYKLFSKNILSEDKMEQSLKEVRKTMKDVVWYKDIFFKEIVKEAFEKKVFEYSPVDIFKREIVETLQPLINLNVIKLEPGIKRLLQDLEAYLENDGSLKIFWYQNTVIKINENKKDELFKEIMFT